MRLKKFSLQKEINLCNYEEIHYIWKDNTKLVLTNDNGHSSYIEKRYLLFLQQQIHQSTIAISKYILAQVRKTGEPTALEQGAHVHSTIKQASYYFRIKKVKIYLIGLMSP